MWGVATRFGSCNTGDLAGLHRSFERRIVDEFAPGAVDDSNALLHLCECFRIQHLRGLVRNSDMQSDVVGAGVEFIERAEFDTQFLRASW